MPDTLHLALRHHQQGQLDEAARLNQAVLAAQPGHPEALHLLGVVAHQKGDHARAVELIGRAIAGNPRDAMYHANLAEAYRALGRLEQAVAGCRAALRLRPHFPEAANNLGMALLGQSKTDDAITQFREALRLKPDYALACNNLGNALRLRGDVGGALAHFRRAVELGPDRAEAHSNLGQLLLERHQPHEALAHLEAAVRLRPDLAEVHNNLGNALRELGRTAAARQAYARALHINPRLAMTCNNMGQALQEENALDEARGWYERALELDPNSPRFRCNLAGLLAEQRHAFCSSMRGSPGAGRVMATPTPKTREANPWSTPLRDLGLKIGGTPLEPVLREFLDELRQRGITRVEPRFYLSTEWGVPFGSVSIAIPFYLARADLTEWHADHGDLVEGANAADVLRYLRHEMGHVVNYAYQLYEEPEWQRWFGDIEQPYEEEYRPRPWSPDFVRHLPGWYAQKHPDEDWAETFAVWLTPGCDWRGAYAASPGALAKLEYCERTMARLRQTPPRVVVEELDEDIGALTYTLDQFYGALAPGEADLSADLREALREVCAYLGPVPPDGGRPLAGLLRRLERKLPAEVYRWTGHFPERTRLLLRRLAAGADKDALAYPAARELEAGVAVTALVTALAMNHVLRGSP